MLMPHGRSLPVLGPAASLVALAPGGIVSREIAHTMFLCRDRLNMTDCVSRQ
jgi:hypothetical protein